MIVALNITATILACLLGWDARDYAVQKGGAKYYTPGTWFVIIFLIIIIAAIWL